MHDFGGDRGNTGQRQRPPAGLGHLWCAGGAIVFGAKRLGFHAQAVDSLLDFSSATQGVAHAKHTVDQVELQLLDTGQLAQLVLDQGLLGRAVHGSMRKRLNWAWLLAFSLSWTKAGAAALPQQLWAW